ncbi:3-ketoacyl-thiolase [Grosmannia clavigera kw1407]|uniref:acetyl-CoA C-acyltransferase n=1 Tax=Grosmannia clavigera (strain kw1407 / UAMH 11150) TaxID=655863 RepID=F0XNQ3_GROCL|nr:3-ketoacyl-thiolase [Grosmannia clavigera kw1407]EFX00072.1 3-ketoacyl-thiolase [Grosmannia clavigera kw1407]
MPYPRGLSALLKKAPSDTVVLSAVRTPICRANRGNLKDAYPEELLATVLRRTLERGTAMGLDRSRIQDVAVGVVLSELGGSKAARTALNHVGFDTHATSLYTVNRACASSLQAVAAVAAQIRVGAIEAGIAAGMESMTRNYGSRAIPTDLWPALRESPVADARDCVMPMGTTSENVASRYGINRADQDNVALHSHRRAAAAVAAGRFVDEIVPVATRFQPLLPKGAPKDTPLEPEQQITVTTDDGIRADISPEVLARLKPAFAADGTSTAGNSSQVSDGAAALLLMRRSTVDQHLPPGTRVLGRFVASATVGCRPDEMGIGPALAIPALLDRLGLSTADVHRWEINEAFASQTLYCLRQLGLESAWAESEYDEASPHARPRALVNPDGGAIALGHPLGATGTRMATTLLHGLHRDGGEIGVASMCIGTGMGMAALFVRE